MGVHWLLLKANEPHLDSFASCSYVGVGTSRSFKVCRSGFNSTKERKERHQWCSWRCSTSGPRAPLSGEACNSASAWRPSSYRYHRAAWGLCHLHLQDPCTPNRATRQLGYLLQEPQIRVVNFSVIRLCCSWVVTLRLLVARCRLCFRPTIPTHNCSFGGFNLIMLMPLSIS